MAKSYDFIIVGGGISGCVLASRLATTPAKPSILLIEAGNHIDAEQYGNPWQKFMNFMTPGLDHGYTQTLKNCGLPPMPYARGKGLGGSSLINFSVYTRGASADYDNWAELLGDDFWRWDHAKERFKQIETLHDNTPEQYKRYHSPDPKDHGYSGPLHISLPSAWEVGTEKIFNAASAYGYPISQDMNSGDPIGWGLPQMTTRNGVRSTSQLFLQDAPQNLEIWADAIVTRILFKGKTAEGVELADGRQVSSNKSVVLTAGAIDSPKLLMLSGVGSADELQKHGIELVHELPGVGKNLQDHMVIPLDVKVSEAMFDLEDIYSKPDEFQKAKELWEKDKSGPLGLASQNFILAYLKMPSVYASDEFKQLEPELQKYIEHPHVPVVEFGLVSGPIAPGAPSPPEHMLSFNALPMCTLSRGEVKLSSKDPATPPEINFNEYSHPFDRLVAIESTRSAMDFVQSPHFTLFRGLGRAPASNSDDDIWEYVKKVSSPSWHASCSVKMGKASDPTACVDQDLFVHGLKKLQVADMSICPLMPNGHTQATAYLIGQSAAEKIIA
ncbi:glucose-methanol-choline oxidoreductase, partial [Xylogone sp. PMI_703]